MIKDQGETLTFPVNLWMIKRETVTVAVLFMYPALVTMPRKAIGPGILSKFEEGVWIM
jgi:hypothetical protein